MLYLNYFIDSIISVIIWVCFSLAIICVTSNTTTATSLPYLIYFVLLNSDNCYTMRFSVNLSSQEKSFSMERYKAIYL